MVSSIGYSLGIGSGIDTQALITSLADAQRAPKEAQIAKRETLNQARISSLAEASGAIDSFASALSSLISGGSLFTQPSVSDSSVLTATAIAGNDISTLSSQIEVRQLAQSQTLESGYLASAAASVGQGNLTLSVAGVDFAITIDAANDSLAGLAKAINDKASGVTASIVTDTNGARLVMKGRTGEANAFTLGVPGGTASGLERFAFGPAVTGGLTAAQVAQDAILRLDGVEVRRSSNVVSDLIPGVQLDLKRAVPGSTVSLGVTRPTAAISQGVGDFVAAYNELHAILATATRAGGSAGEAGPLRGDLSIREMQRQLAQLPSAKLNSGSGFATLAEIGVATNRDGTLRVDQTRLVTALASDPAGVEALFNPRQYSSDPNVVIFSKMGNAKPGTYTLTDLVPQNGPTPASGKVDGLAMISSGPNLISPAASKALGLVVTVLNPVASATITVDSGLGGALQSIRDALRARGGPIENSNTRLSKEAEAIERDREALEMRSEAYYNKLVADFTAMERRVSAFKATQSYLEQQVKIWTNSDD